MYWLVFGCKYDYYLNVLLDLYKCFVVLKMNIKSVI